MNLSVHLANFISLGCASDEVVGDSLIADNLIYYYITSINDYRLLSVIG
jgi:hypothetical protein